MSKDEEPEAPVVGEITIGVCVYIVKDFQNVSKFRVLGTFMLAVCST